MNPENIFHAAVGHNNPPSNFGSTVSAMAKAPRTGGIGKQVSALAKAKKVTRNANVISPM